MIEIQWTEFSASTYFFSPQTSGKKERDVSEFVWTTWCHLLFLWSIKSALSCGGSPHVTLLAQKYQLCKLRTIQLTTQSSPYVEGVTVVPRGRSCFETLQHLLELNNGVFTSSHPWWNIHLCATRCRWCEALCVWSRGVSSVCSRVFLVFFLFFS